MDGVNTSGNVFNALTARLHPYMSSVDIMSMSQCDAHHMEFKNECKSLFRSAVQLLNEGILHESQYDYIIELAFWIEGEVQEAKWFLYY